MNRSLKRLHQWVKDGEKGTPPIAWSCREGIFSVWRKDRWAFQAFFPQLRVTKTEVMFGADTALRVNWKLKAGGFILLGFGLGFTLSPHRFTKGV